MKIIRSIFYFLLIVFLVIVFLDVIPIAPSFGHDNPWIVKAGEKPLIIPHGGAKLLYPENTIYSYQQLDKDGYDVFEIDLTLTKDDILITHHNLDFETDQGETKNIRDLTYDQIIQAKQNFAIDFTNLDGIKPFENPDSTTLPLLRPAKLEDLFKDYPNKKYILELKDLSSKDEAVYKTAVSNLLKLIKEYHMEKNVMVASFDDKDTHLIQKESNNTVYTSTATKDSFNFVIYSTLHVDFFYRPHDVALCLPIHDSLESERSLIDKVPGFLRNQITTYDKSTDTYYTAIVKQSIIDDAHRHNMAVQYWTVNDKATMKKLVKMGVDGIITDRPDLLKEVYAELGE